ncbi:hypothetical protein G6F37_005957 [Rhizopus arrhizus]|nr:hypothetical protein G6F38_007815 [Rhizopus arrhizus]KAG1158253.1 hypothetical protein G6F37_005957 [Rhizopus arrhizus]
MRLSSSIFCKGKSRNFWSSTIISAIASENPYTNIILLPKTRFPLRAEAAKREHLFRDRCTKDLYPWQLKNNPKGLFILHDGPPYANRNVHSAESELEYKEDHVSKSIHVRFSLKELAPALKKKWDSHLKNQDLYALIWTTTPWTIPSNKAISVHPELKYSLVQVPERDKKEIYIVVTDRTKNSQLG